MLWERDSPLHGRRRTDGGKAKRPRQNGPLVDSYDRPERGRPERSHQNSTGRHRGRRLDCDATERAREHGTDRDRGGRVDSRGPERLRQASSGGLYSPVTLPVAATVTSASVCASAPVLDGTSVKSAVRPVVPTVSLLPVRSRMFVVVMPPAPVRFHATWMNRYWLVIVQLGRLIVAELRTSVAPTFVAIEQTCCADVI